MICIFTNTSWLRVFKSLVPQIWDISKKIFQKLAIWGPWNNYYFSLGALHLFHGKTCIAKTKTQAKQKAVGCGHLWKVVFLKQPCESPLGGVWNSCGCQIVIASIFFKWSFLDLNGFAYVYQYVKILVNWEPTSLSSWKLFNYPCHPKTKQVFIAFSQILRELMLMLFTTSKITWIKD